MRKFATKKILALSMVAAMAMTACGGKGDGDAVPTPAPESTATPTPAESGNAGDSGNSGDSGNAGTTEPATYTYNMAMSDFPTNWNIHRYETAIDAYIVDYITDGFYYFDYNDEKDGYALKTGMLSKDVEDVTAEYVGQYGIVEGDTAKAWKLTLRDDLKWDDGTAITAHDFVRSAELLLNPVAKNHRADSLYSGDMAIVGAKDFLYSGQHAFVNPMISANFAPEEYVAVADLTLNEEGVYTTPNGNDLAININNSANWSSNSLSDYHASSSYQPLFVQNEVDLYDEVLAKNADADGYVKVTQEVMDAMNYIIARLHGHDNAEAYAAASGDYAYQEVQEFCFLGETYEEKPFSEVGVFATADNELILVLETALEGFYLKYSLTGSWLVKEDLYLSCESITDGVYNNTYGTSVETTASYGPYKLASYQADKEYILERNDYHYQVAQGLYQTTHIKASCVKEASTRLEYFLSGQLDTYGLTKDDMETYQSSDYTYYTTGASTFFVALNPDMDALLAAQQALGDNYNKTILTVKEFRQALSFALDRAAFALAADPIAPPAFGVFSSQIVSDPDNGITYRSNEEAKWVLAKFWGLENEIGADKMYPTVDDAVESITGYNLELAKQLFNTAYDKAIEQGLMDADDVVQIKIGIPNSTSTAYAQGNEFLVNCYTEAVKGTSLEGKLTFTLDDTLGNGFANALRNNQVDMLFFVGWSGSALNPYGLIEAYTTSEYQYDPSWDTSVEMLEITLDGVAYTASVLDWTHCLSGTEITITAADGTTKTFSAGSNDAEQSVRFQILAALEGAVLETYDMIPLTDDADANLKGMQINYHTEDYIFGVGRHAAYRYLTYNYTDAEWDEFVASQGGKLNYN